MIQRLGWTLAAAALLPLASCHWCEQTERGGECTYEQRGPRAGEPPDDLEPADPLVDPRFTDPGAGKVSLREGPRSLLMRGWCRAGTICFGESWELRATRAGRWVVELWDRRSMPEIDSPETAEGRIFRVEVPAAAGVGVHAHFAFRWTEGAAILDDFVAQLGGPEAVRAVEAAAPQARQLDALHYRVDVDPAGRGDRETRRFMPPSTPGPGASFLGIVPPADAWLSVDEGKPIWVRSWVWARDGALDDYDMGTGAQGPTLSRRGSIETIDLATWDEPIWSVYARFVP